MREDVDESRVSRFARSRSPPKSTSKDLRTIMYSYKKITNFPCADGPRRLPNRPRPSSTAEGNLEQEDDVEIEEGDKKGNKTEESWSMSGDFCLLTS